MTDYVELRCRSAFSFLAGASLPEDLVERAAALGHDALALADTRGVYGAPRFFQAARRAGVRALVGAEMPVAGAGMLWLLVEDRTGYVVPKSRTEEGDVYIEHGRQLAVSRA